jgi:hypothetical protein
MQLIVSAKQIGRKHPILDQKIIEIGDIGHQPTLAVLISAVVTQQVQAYQSRGAEKSIFPIFNIEQIADQAQTGKVGFGAIYNETAIDLNKSIATAIQAFEDGIFAVFADDLQINQLTDTINLTDKTVLTFIRLTFLAGSFW